MRFLAQAVLRSIKEKGKNTLGALSKAAAKKLTQIEEEFYKYKDDLHALLMYPRTLRRFYWNDGRS
jgi:hypothetical protein